jgi:hypothetical protein
MVKTMNNAVLNERGVVHFWMSASSSLQALDRSAKASFCG